MQHFCFTIFWVHKLCILFVWFTLDHAVNRCLPLYNEFAICSISLCKISETSKPIEDLGDFDVGGFTVTGWLKNGFLRTKNYSTKLLSFSVETMNSIVEDITDLPQYKTKLSLIYGSVLMLREILY